MELAQIIQTRQSVRAFRPEAVPQDMLQRIFAALICAPSAGNLQAYEVLVLRERALKARVGEATTACYEPVCEAPLALVFVANAFRSGIKYEQRGIELFCIQDATIAATYAMLAAADQGLATLWVGGFDTVKVSDLLKLKPGLWPVVIMPVGYPNELPERRNRRSVQDVVHELD
ncbi:MAG TPA: nitroreductase family protein [Anaerolineales bacterium]|nr:nitroreductase family protein [Anaerolineales bacterium]